MTDSPRKKAGLIEMARVSTEEADRIRMTQEALAMSGLRAVAHEEQLYKAQIFEDIGRLLLRIEPVKDRVREIIASAPQP